MTTFFFWNLRRIVLVVDVRVVRELLLVMVILILTLELLDFAAETLLGVLDTIAVLGSVQARSWLR